MDALGFALVISSVLPLLSFFFSLFLSQTVYSVFPVGCVFSLFFVFDVVDE